MIEYSIYEIYIYIYICMYMCNYMYMCINYIYIYALYKWDQMRHILWARCRWTQVAMRSSPSSSRFAMRRQVIGGSQVNCNNWNRRDMWKSQCDDHQNQLLEMFLKSSWNRMNIRDIRWFSVLKPLEKCSFHSSWWAPDQW